MRNFIKFFLICALFLLVSPQHSQAGFIFSKEDGENPQPRVRIQNRPNFYWFPDYASWHPLNVCAAPFLYLLSCFSKPALIHGNDDTVVPPVTGNFQQLATQGAPPPQTVSPPQGNPPPPQSLETPPAAPIVTPIPSANSMPPALDPVTTPLKQKKRQEESSTHLNYASPGKRPHPKRSLHSSSSKRKPKLQEKAGTQKIPQFNLAKPVMESSESDSETGFDVNGLNVPTDSTSETTSDETSDD